MKWLIFFGIWFAVFVVATMILGILGGVGSLELLVILVLSGLIAALLNFGFPRKEA